MRRRILAVIIILCLFIPSMAFAQADGLVYPLICGSSTNKITGNFTIQSAAPSIIFKPATSGDTSYWMGLQADANGVDDDLFQIGDGETPGTNAFVALDTSGRIGLATTPNANALFTFGNYTGTSSGSTNAYFRSTGTLTGASGASITSYLLSPTYVATGTADRVSVLYVGGPNLTGTATTASSLYISGPAVGGTVTNNYAMEVGYGISKFGGSIWGTGTYNAIGRISTVPSTYILQIGGNSTSDYDITKNNDIGGLAVKPSLMCTADVASHFGETIKMTSLADANSHTLTQQIGLFVEDGQVGNVGGGTLTISNQYGIYVQTRASGEGTNYGIKIDGPTAAATANYSLYVGAPTGATTNYSLSIGGANGSQLNTKTITEEVTIAVGSGSDPVVATSGNLAPAGSLIKGLSFRITDAPGGGATVIDIGRTNGGNLDEFVDGASCDILGETGTNYKNGDAAHTGILRNISADTLTLTTDADVTGDAMKVRIVVWYEDITAPTS